MAGIWLLIGSNHQPTAKRRPRSASIVKGRARPRGVYWLTWIGKGTDARMDCKGGGYIDELAGKRGARRGR
jgi:hypothetical protein